MNWRIWLKPVIMLLYGIIICVSLPFIVLEFKNENAVTRKEAWLIGGMFVLGAVPISLWTIIEHVVHYTKPYLQRHIIRILWMVPIYALNAWFAIGNRKESIYLDTLRECYEAYVIYNFMAFLLSFLNHEYPDFGYIIEQKSQVKHLIPCCCLPQWTMGIQFINTCRHGVLQYTVVRPVTTLVAFICAMAGVYHPNEFRVDGAYVYLNVVNNISQVWAMYSLIMFYRCTSSELKPLKPMSKFICVKFVVFLSFWQSVLFSILTATKVISRVEAWKLYNPEEISSIFQNFCICIEMFIAAIAHHYSFSAAPYRPDGSSDAPQCCVSCLAMCDLSDVHMDVIDHVKHIGKKLVPGKSQPSGESHTINEQTPLIGGQNSQSDLTQNADARILPPVIGSQESIYSIGSDSSLKDDLPHMKFLRMKDVGSKSSLNNHLQLSQSSAVDRSMDILSEVSAKYRSVGDVSRRNFDDRVESDRLA